MAKFQIDPTNRYISLFDISSNKILKSVGLPNSGDTTIAKAILRTFAKRNGIKVS